jgi:hypothetical protein
MQPFDDFAKRLPESQARGGKADPRRHAVKIFVVDLVGATGSLIPATKT